MVDVLLTRQLSREFLDRLREVDPRVRLREATEPLRQLLRGELPQTPEAVWAAERDAAEQLPSAEVIIGWGRFPADALRWAPQLRWIQATGAGVERLDPRVMERVIVTNATGVGAEPIGDHVLCMTLMLARGAHVYLRRQFGRRWERDYPAREVADMTMCVIGMGASGAAIARRARAVGMRVLGIRRSIKRRTPDLVADEVCPPSDLPAVLAESDVVVLAAPLTPETQGLIGERELTVIRRGAYLINIARSALVDEKAVISALVDGRLGGAALDVFSEEPLPADSPLWGLPNVIITPHVAWSSDRYEERLIDLVCDNLRRYIHGQPLRNVVDPARRY
jgi:phosphoglycerate dehydrogenase-like enzyme